MGCPSTSFSRGLREVRTGAAGVQLEQEGLRVTIITEPIDGSDLFGAAFITNRPVAAFLRATEWEAVFGGSLRLQGGVELDIDDPVLEKILSGHSGPVPLSQTVPVTPRDLYYPAVPMWVRLTDLINACDRCQPGQGHRADGQREECMHQRMQFSCPSCLRSWWIARARLLGIEVMTHEQETEED